MRIVAGLGGLVAQLLIKRKVAGRSDGYSEKWPIQGHQEPPMFQVRIHGRGGQGVVTGAEMLSVTAFFEGRHAQAFPSFGSERMGAPVVAFCRIADQEIRLTSPYSAIYGRRRSPASARRVDLQCRP